MVIVLRVQKEVCKNSIFFGLIVFEINKMLSKTAK